MATLFLSFVDDASLTGTLLSSSVIVSHTQSKLAGRARLLHQTVLSSG